MSNFGDQADAKTIREWYAWLATFDLPLVLTDAGELEKAIATFLAERAKQREESYGK